MFILHYYQIIFFFFEYHPHYAFSNLPSECLSFITVEQDHQAVHMSFHKLSPKS